MTKADLVAQLTDPAKRIPDDAIIRAFDPESGREAPVTGILYGMDTDGKGYSVEFCTDDQND